MNTPPDPGIAVTHVEPMYGGSLFQIERLHLETNDGATLQRDIVRHPGAVVILPLLDDGRVVFIRNYRYAVKRWLLELPAGGLEADEEPAAAATRELEEETGYTCQDIQLLGGFYTSPGLGDEWMHVFVARGLTKTKQQLEHYERIHVELLTEPQWRKAVADASLIDGKSLATLFRWQICDNGSK